MDKQSFVYGMVTAFCECVAAGCKPIALSPPLIDTDFEAVKEECDRLIAAHGLKWYHERNLDIPKDIRKNWLVIYAEPRVLDEYLALRKCGLNIARDIAPFEGVLGYAKMRVNTGYDAYREYFG